MFNNYLVLVNKSNLYNSDDFKDIELIAVKDVLDDTILVERITYNNFLLFQEKLKEMGIIVWISSAYRSLADQDKLRKEFRKYYSAEEFDKKIAKTGTSEHHTGLAIDITLSSKEDWENDEAIETDSSKVSRHLITYNKIINLCADYGFILRYPEGKESITGYNYEPWHYRYVGKEVAKEIMKKEITLEEYLKEKEIG